MGLFSYRAALLCLRSGCLSLVLAAGSLMAAESGVVQLAVPDQGAEAREQAFSEGLVQVLGRIGGDLEQIEPAQRTALEEQAQEYITSYRYLSQAEGWLLEVRFDAAALEEKLKQKGVAVVIDQRPQTLVWLALEQQGQRQLLADGSQLAQQFTQLGQQQAAPLLFPVLDLDDFSRIDTAEVWGLFESPILGASSRYQASSVLAGRVYQDAEGRYQGQWLYLFGERRHRVAIDAADLQAVLTQGAQLVAGQLTDQLLANQQRGSSEMEVEFVGVESTQSYAELLSLVGSLAPVREVQLAAMEPSVVRLQLKIDSAPEVVEQLLARQVHLRQLQVEMTSPAGEFTEAVEPVIALPRFGWQGS